MGTRPHLKKQCRAGILAAAVAMLAVLLPVGGAHASRPEPARQEAAGGHPSQVGVASVYARRLDGRPTASGEVHESNDLTAAHRTLPIGTRVRVTNLRNHRVVVVRINDRGPAVKGRIIDLSPAAGDRIGVSARGKGVARVRVDVIGQPGEALAGNAGGDALASAGADDSGEGGR
jgi:rare lipoprotein A